MGWKGEFGVGRIRITRHGMLKKKRRDRNFKNIENH